MCGEISQVHSFVSSYSSMMHYWNFKEKWQTNMQKRRADNSDKRKSPWRPIASLGEMKAFIGVCVATVFLKLLDLYDYWQQSYWLFEIGQWNEHMSRERERELKTSLGTWSFVTRKSTNLNQGMAKTNLHLTNFTKWEGSWANFYQSMTKSG